jgi:hypothetical protein
VKQVDEVIFVTDGPVDHLAWVAYDDYDRHTIFYLDDDPNEQEIQRYIGWTPSRQEMPKLKAYLASTYEVFDVGSGAERKNRGSDLPPAILNELDRIPVRGHVEIAAEVVSFVPGEIDVSREPFHVLVGWDDVLGLEGVQHLVVAFLAQVAGNVHVVVDTRALHTQQFL